MSTTFIGTFVPILSKLLRNLSIEWKTKYSHKMLRDVKYAKACADILRKIAERHKMELLEVAI